MAKSMHVALYAHTWVTPTHLDGLGILTRIPQYETTQTQVLVIREYSIDRIEFLKMKWLMDGKFVLPEVRLTVRTA